MQSSFSGLLEVNAWSNHFECKKLQKEHLKSYRMICIWVKFDLKQTSSAFLLKRRFNQNGFRKRTNRSEERRNFQRNKFLSKKVRRILQAFGHTAMAERNKKPTEKVRPGFLSPAAACSPMPGPLTYIRLSSMCFYLKISTQTTDESENWRRPTALHVTNL